MIRIHWFSQTFHRAIRLKMIHTVTGKNSDDGFPVTINHVRGKHLRGFGVERETCLDIDCDSPQRQWADVDFFIDAFVGALIALIPSRVLRRLFRRLNKAQMYRCWLSAAAPDKAAGKSASKSKDSDDQSNPYPSDSEAGKLFMLATRQLENREFKKARDNMAHSRL